MDARSTKILTWLLVIISLLIVVYRVSAEPIPTQQYDYLAWALRSPLLTPAPVPPTARPASKPKLVASKKVVKKPVAKKVIKSLAVVSDEQQAANGLCTMAWLRANLWWREVSYNAGPGITEAIRANNGQPREEYCGDTQAAAQRACSLPIPSGSNGSYNWFLDPRRNVLRGTVGSFDNAKVGYKVGIFNPRKGRIAHITAIDVLVTSRNAPAQGGWCIAGNEGSGTKAGMKRTWYPKVNCFAIANWNH